MSRLITLLVVLVAFIALAACFSRDNYPVLDNDLIERVNADPSSTWVAGRNPFFEKMTVKQAKKLMGTVLNGKKLDPLPATNKRPSAVPTSFDSRVQWPGCGSIRAIRDQARCGSCWAFGCVEALSDRFCIHSNYTFNVTLSFMDLVTCDKNDDGCEGGEPASAWEYCQSAGLVTEECSPYTIATCPPQEEPCLNFLPTPPCKKSCVNSSIDWNSDLHYSQRPYGVPANSMASDIQTNGPIEAAFTVYADFVHYTSGVYQHKSGGVLGGHAVKIIGWGVENGTDYWLVANSWTTTWGDLGFFKILKGVDECGIESGCVAGLPNLSSVKKPILPAS